VVLWLVIFWQMKDVHFLSLSWRDFAVVGFFSNAIPFSLFAWVQIKISSSMASILNSMTPIFTILLAHAMLFDEKITASRLVGILTGIAGIFILLDRNIFDGFSESLTGQLACLAAAASHGFAYCFARRTIKTSPLVTASGQITLAAIAVGCAVLFVEMPSDFDLPEAKVIAAVVASAVICTSCAYILFFEILRKSGATNVAMVTFVTPVSAVFFGTVLLGETISRQHAAGMAVIVTSILIIDGRLWQRLLVRR
jgi:drug/metabolite transporter (DMT)-like permease